MGGWTTVRVTDVAAPGPNSMATGPFGSSISSRFFRRSGVPVIRGGNLSTDSAVRLSDKNLVFLDPSKAAEFSRSTVRRGDLIFTCWGTINQVGLIDGSAGYDRYVISNKQMKLTPDPSVVDSEFLYYLFSSPPMQQEILEGWIGSSIPGFNLTRLRSLEIELPPLGEQKRIARALSDAEGVEKRLTDAIAKKQAIKQGLMQRLLTGHTILSGSTKPWIQTKLGTIASLYQPTTISGNQLTESGYPVYGANGQIGFYWEFNHAEPQIAITCRGNTCGTVNFTPGYVWITGNAMVVNADASQVVDKRFLFYLLKSLDLTTLITGSGQPQIVRGPLANLVLHMPQSLEEQRAIASILLEADNEIDLLHRRHAKARAVMQGMMQELLSGRTRLPVAEAVT
jgi:type I restriction enzyme S subunit